MSFDYVICILIAIGILGLFGGWKLINHFNYELKGKESILYSVSLIISSIIFLVDFGLLSKNIASVLPLPIILFFPLILLIYYIIRFIKLKKYVPIKLIIFYIFISVINIIILFFLLDNTNNIDGWSALGLELVYMVICFIYVILLLLINFIIFIISNIKKVEANYKNINYKVSKYSYFNILVIILIIGLIFGIDYFNEYNHNKIIEEQKAFAEKYLKNTYSEYKFEIISVYETGANCWMFGCEKTVLKIDVRNIDFNKNFSIMVNRDLTIYEDEFKEISEQEQKDDKEEKIKKYLKDNYDIVLEYNTIEEIENAYFIIDKEYKKEDINILVANIKNAYNYVEHNLCDLKDLTISFKYGNPFYEGKYDYQKTHGSINENEFTNELWIMVNDEYIFVDKN